MKVGVRFCGGCNPMYDRGAFFDKVKSERKEDQFHIAEEGVKYDCLLVIGGCSSCCAAYKQFDYDRDIKVWEPKDVEKLFDEIY